MQAAEITCLYLAEMNFDMTRVTIDITKLLKVGLDLLEQAHYIFHSVLHLTELYQCTPQLSLTPAIHIQLSTDICRSRNVIRKDSCLEKNILQRFVNGGRLVARQRSE